MLAIIDIFGQTVELHDVIVIGLLVLLEGVLSIDNALVLGLLAKRLPKNLQGKALTYGLVGAFVFRFIAIATATYLLRWRIVKLLGGGYLLYVVVKHFFFDSNGKEESTSVGSKSASAAFWPTVVVIELTDIAFAVDSILAAIALVGSAPPGYVGRFHPKLWVVVAGGMFGVILMRVAAVLFIKLLERFPRFETSAYLLVAVIGAKLLADWGFNSADHPDRLKFHDHTDPVFWVFWISMFICFCIGFLPTSAPKPASQ
jgi:YkoY family integral membrane protein